MSLPFPLLLAQGALAVVAIAAMALSPPASGTMMLVPLPGQDDGIAARAAVAAGALLIGPGPLPRSLVVRGERVRIGRELGGARVLMIAAPFGGCGAGPLARPA